MDFRYFIIPAVIAAIFIILIIAFHFKKKAVIRKVKSLSTDEKINILNDLAKPFGYMYDYLRDIFVARLDAPQKIFGYTTLYDLSAPYFNMIFDYETFYFNYDDRTWLIEMWKGQYGINSGCELGIYYADKILSPDEYDRALFKAADTADMPEIYLKLNRKCPKGHCPYFCLGHMRKKHWWLTIFKPGVFTKPENLSVNTALTFKNYPMMYSFLDSFVAALPDYTYKISGLTIYFTFCKSMRKYSLWKKFVRSMGLFWCRLYCKWFNFLTRPFSRSCDKILYIYYYFPYVLRHLIKQKHRK